MSWWTITLEVETPVFNAGGDRDFGFRVPSLIGAMRFWFRALAGAALGPDLAAVHRAEAAVFGAAAREGGQDHHASSPLQWRIGNAARVKSTSTVMDWLPSSGKHWRQHGADRWLVYLLGQGLGNLEDCGLAEKTQFVDPGTQIELQVRSRRPGSQDEFSLALASLWLTSVVGGVGARTRRGFGCFRILGSDVPREAAPQAPELTSVPAYTDLSGLRFDELDECCDLLMGRSVATRQPASRAGFDSTFPILDMASGDPVGTHTAATVARSGRSERWDHVLRYAGEQWRLARATTDCPDETQAFRRRKTPEWLNAAKGSSQDFPLGALGLPVVFKKGVEVNLVSGSESLRRASPVHFRPVRLGEGLGLFSFTFRSQLLPSGPGYRVTLTRPPKELRIDPQALDVRWQAWVAALAKQPPDRHPA